MRVGVVLLLHGTSAEVPKADISTYETFGRSWEEETVPVVRKLKRVNS